MATRNFTGVDREGTQYVLTVPSNGTVQDIMNAAVSRTWYKFPLLGISVQGRVFKANDPDTTSRSFSNFNAFRGNGVRIHLLPKLSRFGMHPESFGRAKSALRSYLADSNRRTRGAEMRNRINRERYAEQAMAALPNNVLQHVIAPMAGQAGGKTRKNRKSRRQTRRRR